MAASRGSPAPSANANVAISSPRTIFGRYSRFCASLPAARIASAARQTVETNGTGASTRPSSSASTHSAS